MFDKATHRLLRRIDPDGELIAVSRLTDSEKLKPLAVVIKCPAMWFWQTAKYRPTVFTLNDLLQGDPIKPVLEEIDLLKYHEKRKGKASGSLEAGVSELTMSAQGSGASTLSSTLGMLRKENINIQKLLKDSKDRTVDLQHPLIQQKQDKSKSKSKRVFGLVMERIFTTETCKLELSNQEEGSCSAILKTLKMGTAQVNLKESGSLYFDTDVAMEIPPQTVMAYRVRELNIKSDGQYDVRVLPEGFEADDFTEYSEEEVDGVLSLPEMQEGSSLSVLKTRLEKDKGNLCVLAGLSHQVRSSLLDKFRKILLDRNLMSALEDKLDDVVFGADSCLFQTSYSDASDQFIETFVDLLQSETTCGKGINNGDSMKLSEQNQSVLTAMHCLMSAAMGLTDEGLRLLEGFCSSKVLKELNDFVTLLTDDPQPLSLTSLPALLQNDDMLRRVKELFSSSSVELKDDAKKLWAEARSNSGMLPFMLCTVIHGLAYLSETQK